jgi:hypothetical protein
MIDGVMKGDVAALCCKVDTALLRDHHLESKHNLRGRCSRFSRRGLLCSCSGLARIIAERHPHENAKVGCLAPRLLPFLDWDQL